MKVVAKYTIVLVATLAVALLVLAALRVAHDRAHFERDVALDHRVVGSVVQATVVDLWREYPDAEASRRTLALIDRANSTGGPTRFEWAQHPLSAQSQKIELDEFVSRFPVASGGRAVGTVVAREPLDDINKLVRSEIVLSAVSIGLILVFGLIASLVLGRWLVGAPIAQLVAFARRIGHRNFSHPIEVQRDDELGQLAAEMNAMSDELARALAAIALETEARVRAVEQLRHADRLSTIGQLAAGVAHELGTPLSVVSGHAQMISEREVTGDAVLESAHTIDRETKRMGRIVRQLVDFARRKGQVGTICEPSPVVHRCLGLLKPLLERSNVQYSVDESEQPPARILIDEDRLQQAVTNLIVNAVQAMPDGGSLKLSLRRVVASAPDAASMPPKPCVRLDVSDSGPGIPPNVLPHIFEPFFTTKQPGEGTGLGLAVVEGIISDYGGWIDVESSEHGATFSVFLHEVQT
jgi:signal transduction histidine kinase